MEIMFVINKNHFCRLPNPDDAGSTFLDENYYKVRYGLKECFVYLGDFKDLDLTRFPLAEKEVKIDVTPENIIESGRAKYKCTQCDKRFVLHSNLRAHIEEEHYSHSSDEDLSDSEELKYMCKFCNEKFQFHFQLSSHISYEHADDFEGMSSEYDSSDSDESVHSVPNANSKLLQSLRSNSNEVKNNQVDELKNTHQSNIILKKTDRNKCNAINHKNDKRKVEEEDQLDSKYDHLIEKICIRDTGDNKKYPCVVCRTIFSNIIDYRNHLNSHRFTCIICVLKFQTSQQLDAHMTIKHPETIATVQEKLPTEDEIPKNDVQNISVIQPQYPQISGLVQNIPMQVPTLTTTAPQLNVLETPTILPDNNPKFFLILSETGELQLVQQAAVPDVVPPLIMLPTNILSKPESTVAPSVQNAVPQNNISTCPLAEDQQIVQRDLFEEPANTPDPDNVDHEKTHLKMPNIIRKINQRKILPKPSHGKNQAKKRMSPKKPKPVQMPDNILKRILTNKSDLPKDSVVQVTPQNHVDAKKNLTQLYMCLICDDVFENKQLYEDHVAYHNIVKKTGKQFKKILSHPSSSGPSGLPSKKKSSNKIKGPSESNKSENQISEVIEIIDESEETVPTPPVNTEQRGKIFVKPLSELLDPKTTTTPTTETTETTFSCTFCSLTITERTYFQKHQSKVKCLMCSFTACKRAAVNEHAKKEHVGTHKCDYCMRFACNSQELKRHIDTTHKCKLCMKYIGRNLEHHQNRYRCSLCDGYKTCIEGQFIVHVKNNHDENLLCKVCIQTFPNLASIMTHQSLMHPNMEKS